MTPKDLGTKHVCWKCGAKFYDMKKAAPICPKCGSDARQKPSKQTAAEKRAKPPPRLEPVEEIEPGEEAALDKDVDEDFEEGEEPEDDEG